MSKLFLLTGVLIRTKSTERKSAAKKVLLSSIGVMLILGVMRSLPVHAQGIEEATAPVYDFSIETAWLTMRDGVRLAATFFKPKPARPDEKFPVLFEFFRQQSATLEFVP